MSRHQLQPTCAATAMCANVLRLESAPRSCSPIWPPVANSCVRSTCGPAHAEVDVQQLYAGYELTPNTPFVALANPAFASLNPGGVSTPQRSGGGSDANQLNFVAS